MRCPVRRLCRRKAKRHDENSGLPEGLSLPSCFETAPGLNQGSERTLPDSRRRYPLRWRSGASSDAAVLRPASRARPGSASRFVPLLASRSPLVSTISFHFQPSAVLPEVLNKHRRVTHLLIPELSSRTQVRDLFSTLNFELLFIPDSALDATRRFLCAVLPTRAWLSRLPRSPRPNGHRETPADGRPRRYRVLQPPPPAPDAPPRVEFPVCLSHRR